MRNQIKGDQINTQKPIILYYRPAFFCSFERDENEPSPTPNITPRIRLWIRHPAEPEIDYKYRKSFSVDLRRTPQATLSPSDGGLPLASVEVDDHTHNGGYTTIGPSFPQAYSSGGIYLSERIVNEAMCNDGESPFVADAFPRDQTILVLCPPGARYPVRYHGFYEQRPARIKYPNLRIVWHSGTRSPNRGSAGCQQATTGSLASDDGQWRPPRKLWVPDEVVYRGSAAHAADTAAPVSPVYLEQMYATYVAAIDVPKQPSGAGEGGSVTPSKHIDLSEDRPRSLSVISKHAPGEVGRIKQVLEHAEPAIHQERHVEVREHETLVDALSRHLAKLESEARSQHKPLPQFANLDIIGHSRSRDGILKLGEIALTSRVAADQFSQLYSRNVLQLLGIQNIRLLGCRTAAHARGQRVVRVIRTYTNSYYNVWATRTDLFAVHYDPLGFRESASPLLADHEVIMSSGPGDVPPRDDYPAEPPRDDDDDYGPEVVIPAVPAPNRFSLAALSDVNAAIVSAKNYLFWDWEPAQFDALVDLVYADRAERDNPLQRAEHEVLLSTSMQPSDTSDFLSFDLFLHDPRPRVRVNVGGVAFAFRFKACGDELRRKLNDKTIGIGVGRG